MIRNLTSGASRSVLALLFIRLARSKSPVLACPAKQWDGKRTRRDYMHIGKSAKTVRREDKITDVHLVAPVLALLAPRPTIFRPHLWGAAISERHSCQDRHRRVEL